MNVAVDTNVVAYYLLGTGSFTEECRDFWKRIRGVTAPGLWQAEIVNVLWMAVRTKVISSDESLKKLWDKKTLQALAWNPDRTLAAKEVRKMLCDFMILRNEKFRKLDGFTIVAIPNMKLYEVDLKFTPEKQAAYNDSIIHFQKIENFTHLNMLQQIVFAP